MKLCRQRRTPVKLEEISDNLKKATLAIEDYNFYKHGGFDVKGLVRGMYRTIFQKRLQGGSTLTQQLVKNALLSPERTISRKRFKEAILTIATEIIYSKDQIWKCILIKLHMEELYGEHKQHQWEFLIKM